MSKTFYCAFVATAVSVNLNTLIFAQLVESFSGPTMGTRYTVTIVGEAESKLQRKIDARLAEINRLMSTYDPESELSRFNQYQGTDWFAVSKETALVAQFALQVAADTGGAFDPTVGPAVNLWGFGPDGRRNKPPSDAEIAAALDRVGYLRVAVCADPPALRKERADIYLDLSSVVEGYAVDEVSSLLAKEDHDDSLVGIGGEIYARGRKPNHKSWRIGIEEPDRVGKPVNRAVNLEDAAASTSGDWQNAFLHGGVRYSHIIDPKTARPVQHELASVTVFADTTMQADAWSTSLLVMGDERGIAWCEKNKVAAMFFLRRPGGAIVARASTCVAKRVTPVEASAPTGN